jgi:hypothetical protein
MDPRQEVEHSQPSATGIPPPPPLPPPPRRVREPAGTANLAPTSQPRERVPDLPNVEDARAKKLRRPFQPCHMFFYGSPMDPDVVQAIHTLPEPPTLQPVTISDFQIKMWGISPALVPSEPGILVGRVWKFVRTTAIVSQHMKLLRTTEWNVMLSWKMDRYSVDVARFAGREARQQGA